jgi:hypothetical protein
VESCLYFKTHGIPVLNPLWIFHSIALKTLQNPSEFGVIVPWNVEKQPNPTSDQHSYNSQCSNVESTILVPRTLLIAKGKFMNTRVYIDEDVPENLRQFFAGFIKVAGGGMCTDALGGDADILVFRHGRCGVFVKVGRFDFL